MNRSVHKAAGGVLSDYVPFNFCPRSVMLSAHFYNTVQGYEGGQQPIVHLVSSINTIQATGLPWFFTDRHAELDYAGQYETLPELDKVDWSVMPLTYWAGDPKELRMAEFLVHDFCPWSAIESIGVIDNEIESMVRDVIAGAEHQPQVNIKRNWYY